MTRAPQICANCTAYRPTAPAPPWTNTRSPGSSFARSISPCHEVKAPIGTEAAALWSKVAGFRAIFWGSVIQNSAVAPSANQSFMPYTWSPTSKSWTSLLIAVMTREILGRLTTDRRSGPTGEQVVHAIDLVAHLEALDIFADRRDEPLKFVPW